MIEKDKLLDNKQRGNFTYLDYDTNARRGGATYKATVIHHVYWSRWSTNAHPEGLVVDCQPGRSKEIHSSHRGCVHAFTTLQAFPSRNQVLCAYVHDSACFPTRPTKGCERALMTYRVFQPAQRGCVYVRTWLCAIFLPPIYTNSLRQADCRPPSEEELSPPIPTVQVTPSCAFPSHSPSPLKDRRNWRNIQHEWFQIIEYRISIIWSKMFRLKYGLTRPKYD